MGYVKCMTISPPSCDKNAQSLSSVFSCLIAGVLTGAVLTGCLSNPCGGEIQVAAISEVDNGSWVLAEGFSGSSSHSGALGLQFVDDSVGYIYSVMVDYTTLRRSLFKRTTDGGATWTAVYPDSQVNGFPRAFHFVNRLTGWVVWDGGLILKTTDGGESWKQQPTGSSHNLLGLHFLDTLTGYVVAGGGAILKTTNGGASWTTTQSGSGWYLLDVDFSGSSRGVAVGGRGRIVQTTNAGASWILRDTSFSSRDLRAVRFSDANTVWAAGGGSATRGALYKSTDGGTTWNQHPQSFPFPLYSLFFLNADTGYAVGGGLASWSRPEGAPTSSVCDDPRIPQYSTILKTTDGGIHWFEERTKRTSDGYRLSNEGGNGGKPLLSVACLPGGVCFAGDNETVVKRR